MFKFTWHALMIYFLYVSLIYIIVWYIYMGVLYIYLEVFFIFLGMMNGGGLPAPQAPCFYPGDLPFAPSPDRVVPRFPDPSIVWNFLIFTC